MDKDEDGILTFCELRVVMRALGQQPDGEVSQKQSALINTNFPETKLLKMVRSVSEDKVYNTIEFNEFLQMMAKQQQGEINEEALMEAFRQDLLSLIW